MPKCLYCDNRVSTEKICEDCLCWMYGYDNKFRIGLKKKVREQLKNAKS